MNSHHLSIDDLRKRVEELKSELKAAETLLAELTNSPIIASKTQFSVDEKLQIFSNLFVARRDVYAKRFESKNGNSGYAPVCVNRFKSHICDFRMTKCSACPHRVLDELTENILFKHLSGNISIGVYPLFPGDLCQFLAVDFDKLTFEADVKAFVATCEQYKVPVYIERSRSGNGAHVWFFFEEKISATDARHMGSFLLNKTIDNYPNLLDSYDRLIPNQDQIPIGGFGNLIALPLQKGPRLQGNSVFVNKDFVAYQNQWQFLADIRRISTAKVMTFVPKEHIDEIEAETERWALTQESIPPWEKKDVIKSLQLKEGCKEPLVVTFANKIYFEKTQLSPALQTALMRLASFQNPDFFMRQKQRLNTFGIPKLIYTFDNLDRYLALPRGLFDKVSELLNEHQIAWRLDDKRLSLPTIDVTFKGKLRANQEVALQKLLKNNDGVLSATTAFGKTVVGIAMLAKRNVPTLILVHRTQLAQQWKERLKTFLELEDRQIGLIGAGKFKPTHKIDIAVIQSLSRKERLHDILSHYEMIIVDECHHVAAVSFEMILKESHCRYVLGLSATVTRKDGRHPIVYMQCGPCRHRVNQRQEIRNQPFKHYVLPRPTGCQLSRDLAHFEKVTMAEIYNDLANNKERNEHIVKDIKKALSENRNPVLITARKAHLDSLSDMMQDVPNVFVMQGGMGKKQQKALLEKFFDKHLTESRVLLTTGAFLGEGFDDPRLDTLFLALPVSHGAALIQYAGRLHRIHDQKREVRIYDYRDELIGMTERMFQRRMKKLLSIGYEIEDRCGSINYLW